MEVNVNFNGKEWELKPEFSFEGKKLLLQQEAYISADGTTYEALASCGDEEYQVFWEITCDDDQGDESNACDWEKPFKIEKIS